MAVSTSHWAFLGAVTAHVAFLATGTAFSAKGAWLRAVRLVVATSVSGSWIDSVKVNEYHLPCFTAVEAGAIASVSAIVASVCAVGASEVGIAAQAVGCHFAITTAPAVVCHFSEFALREYCVYERV